MYMYFFFYSRTDIHFNSSICSCDGKGWGT